MTAGTSGSAGTHIHRADNYVPTTRMDLLVISQGGRGISALLVFYLAEGIH